MKFCFLGSLFLLWGTESYHFVRTWWNVHIVKNLFKLITPKWPKSESLQKEILPLSWNISKNFHRIWVVEVSKYQSTNIYLESKFSNNRTKGYCLILCQTGVFVLINQYNPNIFYIFSLPAFHCSHIDFFFPKDKLSNFSYPNGCQIPQFQYLVSDRSPVWSLVSIYGKKFNTKCAVKLAFWLLSILLAVSLFSDCKGLWTRQGNGEWFLSMTV